MTGASWDGAGAGRGLPKARARRGPRRTRRRAAAPLDAIGDHADPLHVARFGAKLDAQGVLAGSKDSGRCIRYLTKYLTKHIAGCHQADSPAQEQHAARLLDALRYEPCSPTCANWLRYGIQPKSPREDMRPGYCKGKAHRAENLGYRPYHLGALRLARHGIAWRAGWQSKAAHSA